MLKGILQHVSQKNTNLFYRRHDNTLTDESWRLEPCFFTFRKSTFVWTHWHCSVLSIQKHYVSEQFFPPAGPASQLGRLRDREELQVSVLLACHVVDSCCVRRTVSLLDLLFWITLFLVGWQSRANTTCVISWTSFVASLMFWSVEEEKQSQTVSLLGPLVGPISYWLCDKNCKCKLCYFSV